MTLGPDFSSAVATKPKPATSGHASRLVRSFICAHLVAAVVTAAYQIDFVSGGLIREFGWNPESLSIPAFFTVFLFPPMVRFATKRAGLKGRAFWWPTLATLALSAFQFLAILPAVQ